MARLITVSVEAKSEQVRQVFQQILSSHRAFVLTPANSTSAVDVLILELDEANPQRTFANIRSRLTSTDNTEIFLTAVRTEPQIILEAFRLGVKEFLPQPFNQQEIVGALGRLEERFKAKNPQAEGKAGKVVSVIGAKGGIGTSTVATNLAFGMRQAAEANSIALVDLNFQNSDLPLFLDIPVPRGLRDLSHDLSRLDPTILQTVLARHDSGVHLLSSGYDGLEEAGAARTCVSHTLNLMCAMYDYVFVDCGHIVTPSITEAFHCSSEIIVVMTLNLPAIRSTKRLLERYRHAAYPDVHVTVVVNRYTDRDEELVSQTEDVLQHKIEGRIPNDYSTVSRAISNGKPLPGMVPRAAITQWFVQRAGAMALADCKNQNGSTAIADAKKTPFLSRYWSGFSLGAKAKLQTP